MKILKLVAVLAVLSFLAGCDSSSEAEPPVVQDKCSLVSVQELEMCFSFTGTANERIHDDIAQVNGATLTTDRSGNVDAAYEFDGVDDYIRLSNPTYQLNGSFTISTWMQLDEAAATTVRLMDTRNTSFSPNNSLNIYYAPTSKELSVAGEGISVFDLDFDEGNWFNLIIVYDALETDEKVEAYLNGIQIDMLEDGFTGHTYNNEDIIIGARADLVEVFNGKIDDLLIFDRAFEENELAQLLSL